MKYFDENILKVSYQVDNYQSFYKFWSLETQVKAFGKNNLLLP
jgi:hypothetical protein